VSTIHGTASNGDHPAPQLFSQRLTRLKNAIQLQQPDRIPVMLCPGYLAADLAGLTRLEFTEDRDKADQALAAFAQRFLPDGIAANPANSVMSRMLGEKMTKWPGYGLDENQSFQFHEHEFMKAEDYDAFLEDPGDWCIRKYLPRAYSELQGLGMLPRFGMAGLGYFGMSGNIAALAAPPVRKALEVLLNTAEAQAKIFARFGQSIEYLAAQGFAPAMVFGYYLAAPFDYMSDALRGMRGIFLDLRRNPEKLLAAEEKLINIQLESAIGFCRAMNQSVVFFPLHRGSDGFISLRDFEKFYWPQLKRVLLPLIDAGITPSIFYEGCWDQRLEYLAELPKGKTIGWFQNSDLFKVKKVLGDTMCIVGGVKISMLSGGASPTEIREHTQHLCEEVGKGGGFIMSNDIAEMEGAKPELVEVWMDATRQHGSY